MTRQELLISVRILLLSPDGQDFSRLLRIHPLADLADALEGQDIGKVAALLMTLPEASLSELFTHLSKSMQDTLLPVMPREVVVSLFEKLPSDDRADIFNRLDSCAKQALLPAMAKVERDDILKMASYPEGSVGSVTTSEYATVGCELTVEAALQSLRTSAPNKETIYVIYVLDTQRRLQGTLSLRELVMADPHEQISALMRPDPIFCRIENNATEAAELIRHYDLLALPILNREQRMIGIVTVDDAMDIEKDQDAAQLARFGGTPNLGGPDLHVLTSPLKQMFKVRLFWLVILTIFGAVASTFIAQQEEILSEVLILAAFMPIIIDMGGNTGSQSATLVLRSMALGELRLRWRDLWFVIRREIPVAIALGGVIAVLDVILAYFTKGIGIDVMMVVGFSMLACTALGGIIGAALPFIARRMGTDPAALSSPLITSVMDLLGLFIYFGFANLFLGHLLK